MTSPRPRPQLALFGARFDLAPRPSPYGARGEVNTSPHRAPDGGEVTPGMCPSRVSHPTPTHHDTKD